MAIGLDLWQEQSPLLSEHELNCYYTDRIYPSLQTLIENHLIVLYPNWLSAEPFKHEDVQTSAIYILENQRSPYVNLAAMLQMLFMPYRVPVLNYTNSLPTHYEMLEML